METLSLGGPIWEAVGSLFGIVFADQFWVENWNFNAMNEKLNRLRLSSSEVEELRQQGREKLMENIEQGKYKIDSSLPKNEAGESASEIANNVIADQITNMIKF